MSARTVADPRRGPLGWITGVLYALLTTQVAFVVAGSPGFAGLLLLARDASNIPLYALSLVPLGPAFAAMLAALSRLADADDLEPWRRFWRAYAGALRDVLPLWGAALGAATVLATNIAFGPATGIDPLLTTISAALLVPLALWTANVLVIGGLFSFRLRDTARLALLFLGARPLAALGTASLAVLATALVAATNDVVLVLAAPLFAVALLRTSATVRRDVAERFTR